MEPERKGKATLCLTCYGKSLKTGQAWRDKKRKVRTPDCDCQWCGAELVLTGNMGQPKRYCGKPCRSLHVKYLEMINREPSEAYARRPCAICDKVFTPRKRAQKCCMVQACHVEFAKRKQAAGGIENLDLPEKVETRFQARRRTAEKRKAEALSKRAESAAFDATGIASVVPMDEIESDGARWFSGWMAEWRGGSVMEKKPPCNVRELLAKGVSIKQQIRQWMGVRKGSESDPFDRIGLG